MVSWPWPSASVICHDPPLATRMILYEPNFSCILSGNIYERRDKEWQIEKYQPVASKIICYIISRLISGVEIVRDVEYRRQWTLRAYNPLAFCFSSSRPRLQFIVLICWWTELPFGAGPKNKRRQHCRRNDNQIAAKLHCLFQNWKQKTLVAPCVLSHSQSRYQPATQQVISHTHNKSHKSHQNLANRGRFATTLTLNINSFLLGFGSEVLIAQVYENWIHEYYSVGTPCTTPISEYSDLIRYLNVSWNFLIYFFFCQKLAQFNLSHFL